MSIINYNRSNLWRWYGKLEALSFQQVRIRRVIANQVRQGIKLSPSDVVVATHCRDSMYHKKANLASVLLLLLLLVCNEESQILNNGIHLTIPESLGVVNTFKPLELTGIKISLTLHYAHQCTCNLYVPKQTKFVW